MPKCQNCHEGWGWKQTMKAICTLDVRLTCPHCGTKQHLTPKARKRGSRSVFVIPVVFLLVTQLNISPITSLSLYALTFIGLVAIYPFMIELSNQAESGWK